MKNLNLDFSLKPTGTRFFIIIITFLLCLQISYSQWIPQNPPDNGGVILGINFTDENHGVVGGRGNEIEIRGTGFYTTNGGMNWNSSYIPNSVRAIVDIQFLSQNTGFAVGAYNTTNSKSLDPISIYNNLTARIHSNNLGLGGIPDYKGILLKTIDAGISWFTFGIPDDFYNYIYKIVLISKDTALITGSNQMGSLLIPGISKTTDGGLSWDRLNVPVDSGDFNEIIYTDNTIFGVGNQRDSLRYKGVIIRSTDFGITWTKKLFYDINNFTDIKFIDENTGYACGADQEDGFTLNSSIYKTTDAGIHWSRLNYNFDSLFIDGICVKENSTALMLYGNRTEYVGNGYFTSRELKIGTTTNSGMNWSMQTLFDSSVLTNSQYYDSLNVFVIGGNFKTGYFTPIVLHSTNGGFTFVNSINQSIPDEFNLFQNYPNPFNPVTIIRYSITGNHFINLKVFDALGKEVSTLVNEKQNTGSYEVEFRGSSLGSGVYFYRLQTDNFSETRKMLLLK